MNDIRKREWSVAVPVSQHLSSSYHIFYVHVYGIHNWNVVAHWSQQHSVPRRSPIQLLTKSEDVSLQSSSKNNPFEELFRMTGSGLSVLLFKAIYKILLIMKFYLSQNKFSASTFNQFVLFTCRIFKKYWTIFKTRYNAYWKKLYINRWS